MTQKFVFNLVFLLFVVCNVLVVIVHILVVVKVVALIVVMAVILVAVIQKIVMILVFVSFVVRKAFPSKFTYVVDNDTTVHDVHTYTVAFSPSVLIKSSICPYHQT